MNVDTVNVDTGIIDWLPQSFHIIREAFIWSNPDPLNFADADVVVTPVVKAGGAESVAASRRFSPGTGRATAYHARDIATQQRFARELARLADRRTEQRPLAVV